MFPPSKKPTPAEYGVLVVVISLAFFVLGVIALVVALRAPAAKHDLAVEVALRGLLSIGIGAAILVAFWLYRRFSD